MSSKRMDLNKCCFFILSGVTNSMAESLTDELCRYFTTGSVVLLIDVVDERLQMIRKNVEYVNPDLKVLCYNVGDWEKIQDKGIFRTMFSLAIEQESGFGKTFELAFIIHNEGNAATEKLIEPQDPLIWQQYVKQRLYFTVNLNQEFIKYPTLNGIPKLVVNITSSLTVQPLNYRSLLCSCKKSRDMYFRSMAAQEKRNNIFVLNYAPGIFKTHLPERDINNNIVLAEHFISHKKRERQYVKYGKVQPKQATLKLINILQEISFISGHEVDYYDTYNL